MQLFDLSSLPKTVHKWMRITRGRAEVAPPQSMIEKKDSSQDFNTTPTIETNLKGLYGMFFKKKYYIISATISDDNKQIIPDPDMYQKKLIPGLISPGVLPDLARLYLLALRSGTATDYSKPRYIFLNNMIKPILISFLPSGCPAYQRLWFDGTLTHLKASLKCNLPVISIEGHENLENFLRINSCRSSD